MPPNPFFLAFACLILAVVPARAESPAAGAEASDDGKLIPGTAFDGQFSMSLDYPISEGEGGMGFRSGLLARWNPSFLGWDARLAAGTVLWTTAIPGSEYSAAHTRLVSANAALDEAWLRYSFPMASWTAAFQAGFFRWRSHPDAALAGEYLARWGAYPVEIIRPGWGYESLDSLTTELAGLRLALASPGRAFGQEILAVLDKRQETTFFTLIGSATFAPLPGLEAGIGAAFHAPMDSRQSYTYAYPVLNAHGEPDTIQGTDEPMMRYATLEFRSLAYSARMSVDLATWITGASRQDRGGRLYTEAAVLGWKDYPYYYPERMRRIQFCAGLTLPAFGILDALRLQAERRSYPWGDQPNHYYGYSPTRAGAERASSRWIGQVHVSRTLLPWLEAQGLALWALGPDAAIPYDFSGSAPAPGSEVRPRTDDAGWAYEARISARL